MSIVERTLKKLQAAAAQAPRSDAAPVGSPMGAHQQPVHSAQRRVTLGDPSKMIHIDHDRLRAQGLLAPEHAQRELAHQYRTLKRPLIKQAFEGGKGTAANGSSLRLIMVSSALPGEGKTFTSINLAMSLSLEKDHSVLLVDGDVPKPHVTQTFGLLKEQGLLDALVDPNSDVASAVVPTDVPGFSILPVGRRDQTAPELLASARMRHVITRLEQLDPQGLVVVDSPPILLTSEARVLASLFGQVVLVVQSGETQQKSVLEAIDLIGEGPRVGLVLNQAAPDNNAGNYYGYYYGTDTPGSGDTLPLGRISGSNNNEK